MSNKKNLFRIPAIYIDTVNNNEKKNNLVSQKVTDHSLSTDPKLGIPTLSNNNKINISEKLPRTKISHDLLQKDQKLNKNIINNDSDKSEYIIEEQINKELNNINNKIKNFNSDTSEESEKSEKLKETKFKKKSNKKQIIETSNQDKIKNLNNNINIENQLNNNNNNENVNKNGNKNENDNENVNENENDNDNVNDNVNENENDNVNENENDILSQKKPSNNISNKKLFYWEYGNSGIKIKEFNKIMCNNLAILYYINKIFEDYFSVNKSETSISDFFDTSSNKFSCEYGMMYSKNNSIVNVKLEKTKLNGLYNIIAAGRTIISNITIDNDDLNNLQIPDLDSLLNNITNINYIMNIINILSIQKYDIINNSSDENFTIDVFINSISDIINISSPKLLKSNNTSAFYIKIYETYGKAFIIDYKNKLIYYIYENQDYDNQLVYINYYILKIDNRLRIKKI
jgi:hypothetical protein